MEWVKIKHRWQSATGTFLIFFFRKKFFFELKKDNFWVSFCEFFNVFFFEIFEIFLSLYGTNGGTEIFTRQASGIGQDLFVCEKFEKKNNFFWKIFYKVQIHRLLDRAIGHIKRVSRRVIWWRSRSWWNTRYRFIFFQYSLVA